MLLVPFDTDMLKKTASPLNASSVYETVKEYLSLEKRAVREKSNPEKETNRRKRKYLFIFIMLPPVRTGFYVNP